MAAHPPEVPPRCSPQPGVSPSLEPGVPQSLDGLVTRVVAPNGGLMTGPGTNTYLVGREELLIIDPGPDVEAHVKAIIDACAGRPVRWILCTHTHFDHAPAAVSLRRQANAPIGAMAAPLTDHDCRLEIDRPLRPEDLIELPGVSLRAIHTPGHASNHVCFRLDCNGMLFTGDHIMQGSTVVIWPPDGNMRAYLRSLRLLLDLDLRVLAPGHGHLIPNPRAEVERLIRHRLQREEKVRRAVVDSGAGATLKSLLPITYDDVPKALYDMAARSLRAHLDKLVEDGELECADGSYRITMPES